MYSDVSTTIVTPLDTRVNQVDNQVQGSVDNIFDDILQKLQEFIDWIQGIWDSITGWFESLIGTIVDALGSIYDWISEVIANVSAWITSVMQDVYSSVSEFLGGVIQSVSDWITGVYEAVRQYVENVVNTVGDWITTTYSTISEWIGGVVQGIIDTYEGVKKTLEDWFGDLIDWIGKIRDEIVAWWKGLLKSIANFIDLKVQPALENARKGAQAIIDWAKLVWSFISKGDFQGAFNTIDKFFQGIGLPAPVKMLQSIVSTIAYFWETVHLQFVGMELYAQKQAMISAALEPLDLSTATQAVYKGLMTEQAFMKNASLAGLAGERAKVVVDANRPLPTPGQIQDAFLRGELTLHEHDDLLKQYGLSGENIALIKQLYLLIPGVSDLIRMAVREAFTPEIYKRFGQDQDFPTEFANWAVKQGLSKDWALKYWVAHWELPSATMGFEMLHRDVIDDNELKLLLRALDVMPYWREKLIKISYNPLTRVDVRRMYQLGVLDEKQVKRAYLDLGYDDQKAGWLTEFTIRYYTPEDQNEQDEFKTLARGVYSNAFKKHIISESEYRSFLKNLRYYADDIDLLVQIDTFKAVTDDKIFDLAGYRKDWVKLLLNAYDRGLFHRNEILPMLKELGYDDNEASLEVGLIDYNRELTLRNMVVEQVREQYITYIIDNVGAHTILDQFNFTSEEIGKLQQEWDIERNLRVKRPPLSDLRKFLASGLITLEQYLDELRGEGYNERYIDLYAQQLASA